MVTIGDEAIDTTARQFDPSADAIVRHSFVEAWEDWKHAEKVYPDEVQSLFKGNPHQIPASWRDLLKVDPPDTQIGWPYDSAAYPAET